MNSEWMILSYSQNGTLPDLPRDHLIDGLFEAVRKKSGQSGKISPARTTGYENDKTTELLRPV